jgi:hypothetical protein
MEAPKVNDMLKVLVVDADPDTVIDPGCDPPEVRLMFSQFGIVYIPVALDAG